MAYEVRGSMTVFLALIVTASFTSFYRITTIVFLLAYSVYTDTDVLANIPFFTGALLADISLVADNSPVLPIWDVKCCGRRVGGVKIPWPVFVFILGLYVGSYPPNSHEMRGWSEMLYRLGETVFPDACILP
jgi:hypothetical protein